MRNTFADTVIAASSERSDIFVITGDAGLGVFDTFKEERPDAFLNLGVAEQNAISFAAGMAMCGHKVFYYNIIPFVLYRCYEQVRNDVCYQNLPVVLVGIGSGITYAPAGMTHYSVEDIGLARTLPNLTVISPADPVEARLAAEYSLMAPEPVFVRLAKRGEPELHTEKSFDISRVQVLKEGSDVAIVFHGSISSEVMAADAELRLQGINPLILSVPMVQPIDSDGLLSALRGFKAVISVEEHFSTMGLGSILREIHSKFGPPWSIETLGIIPEFIHNVRDTEGLREHYGINAASITRKVRLCLAR